MATRVELLEKAKAAKAAKAAGTVGAFVADSKQKKASAPKSTTPAPSPTAAAPAPASPLKSGNFGGLSNLRRSSAMDEEDGVADLDGGFDEVHEDQMGRMSMRPTATVQEQPSSITATTPDLQLQEAADQASTSVGQVAHQPKSASSPVPTPAPALASAPTRSTAPASPTRTAFAGLVAGAKGRLSSDYARSEKLPEIKLTMDADPAWEERSIPAGSQFSLAEWNAARDLGDFVVFELRSGSQGALVQVPRAPTVSQSPQKVIVNGKVGTEADVGSEIDPYSTEYMCPLTAILVESCLLLGPKATTTHPAAATSLYTVRMPDGKDWQYRVVRPPAHRDDPQTAWLFTARGRLPYISEVPKESDYRLTDNPISSHQDVVVNEVGNEQADVVRERMTS